MDNNDIELKKAKIRERYKGNDSADVDVIPAIPQPKLFDVNKSKLSIISGEKSKLKKVLIKDTKLDVMIQKLMFVLDSVNKGN